MLGPVRAPGIVQRHPELRWLASLALLVAVVATVATSVSGVFREDTALSVTGPDQLISQLRAPYPGGYSGTFTSTVELGLPRPVSSVLTAAAPDGALLRGSHSMRYWYGGPDRQRVAVITQTSEQDVFRNGSTVWQWDTASRVAQRSTVAASPEGAVPLQLASAAALSPPQLASQILDLVGKDSDTTLRSGVSATDRPTYELVVHPDSAASRIGEVHIQVDGRQAVPLGVQIYSLTDDQNPVLDVSFQTINYARPAGQNFDFVPPAGATIRTSAADAPAAVLDEVTTLGTGWTTVMSYRSSGASGKQLADVAQGLLGDGAHRVKGRWGKGRLLYTPILTVLVTDKGRIVVGAVTADVLYKAVS
jgi:outer membrane lipoprotein-sorting protein